jgi:hypothetical protein
MSYPGDDYREPTPSRRNRLAHTCHRLLAGEGLCDPARAPERSLHGRCWVCPFSRPSRGTRGNVLVFGPQWLEVHWHTQESGLPRKGRRVFRNPYDALAFVVLAFVEERAWEAASLPRHVPRATCAV